jgi:uncharacterized protein YkwD
MRSQRRPRIARLAVVFAAATCTVAAAEAAGQDYRSAVRDLKGIRVLPPQPAPAQPPSAPELTAAAATPPTESSPAPTAYDQQILQAINDYRQRIGRRPLVMDLRIWRQARAHSSDMASGAVPLGHAGFGARIAALNAELGPSRAACENAASGYDSAVALVNGWLNSSHHRENIERKATRTGISAVQSATGVWFYTQVFY